MTITTKIVRMTPGDARLLLSRNPHNRHVRRAHVERLRRLMLAGLWHLNGETLKLSGDLDIVDGQHRLMALAGIDDDEFGVEFLVVTGGCDHRHPYRPAALGGHCRRRVSRQPAAGAVLARCRHAHRRGRRA